MNTSFEKYKILIIDDNPFPLRECVLILFEKFLEELGETNMVINSKINEEFVKAGYDKISNYYAKIRGKTLEFFLPRFPNIIVYNYDAGKPPLENQEVIQKLINKYEINILWTDLGHSKFTIRKDKLYKINTEHESRSTAFFCNTDILSALTNGPSMLHQVAVYSYSPSKLDLEIDEIKIYIEDNFTQFGQGKHIKNRLFIIETSPILNLFNNEHTLSYKKNSSFRGHVEAFKAYGQLVGSMLFDLFLKIPELKHSRSKSNYNFFNTANEPILGYIKLLNTISEGMKAKRFKIGMVSFSSNVFGKEEFLIDAPYKDYYEKYDSELYKEINENEPKRIIDAMNNYDAQHNDGHFIYYQYCIDNENPLHYKFYLEMNANTFDENLAENYLPLLHTGVFYEPNFYKAPANRPFFKRMNQKLTGRFHEIYYLFKKTSFSGQEGTLNIVFWRENIFKAKKKENQIDSSREVVVQEFWKNQYKLIEPKAAETFIPILMAKVKSEAIRAAISQVMARNTSHNIGAHVMNKLIGDLRAIGLFLLNNKTKHSYQTSDIKLLRPDIINNIEKSDWLKSVIEATRAQKDKTLEKINEEIDQLKNDALANEIILAQISIFNNYVKCRMDYLADISFGTPLMQTNKYAFGDLFKSLDEVRLLLEYISGLSDFKYNIKFKKNGEPLSVINDLLVAIPNDILGMQAFYNILENIIRNTAKHSDKTNLQGEPVVFTVNFIDEPELKNEEQEAVLSDFVAVEVYDNIDVEGDITDSKQKAEYEDKVKKGPVKKINWLVYSQNKELNKDILHDSKLRSSSLGLIEMDASSAYLRKRDVSFINHSSYQLNYDNSWSRLTTGKNCRHFLKAFNKREKDKSFLGYRFFLHRPDVVLVVVSDDNAVENKDELKKQGVWIKTKKEFEDDLTKGKVYSHEFVIHTDLHEFGIKTNEGKKVNILEHYKTSLSQRIIKVSDKELTMILTKSKMDEFEKECWEKWHAKEVEIFILGSYNSNYPDKFQAVFLDHLYSINGNLKESSEAETLWNENKAARYVEALSSLAQSKMPDFNKLTSSNFCNETLLTEKFKKCYLSELGEIVKQKLIESILTRIVVIDERIQEAAENNWFMGVSYKELYAKMNVVVPDKGNINLSENSFTEVFIEKSIKPFISEQVKGIKPTDFVLIHYSILERMFNKEEINRYIEEELTNINVVVTSGRGIPDNLTEKARFINLSSVITAFVDVRSKYAINYLLNSSRKSKKA